MMREKATAAALTFAALLTTVAPFVVLLALPMFDGGIFRQTETVSVGIHIASCAAAATMLVLTMTAPALVRAALGGPVLALGAIGLIGLLTLPFSDDPARSLHGSLEHGIGALWHFEAAALAALACIAWTGRPRWRPVMAAGAALSVVACCVLQVSKLRWGTELLAVYDFPEYLGLDALLASVPLLALRRGWANAAGVALAGSGAVEAGNRSAGLAIAAAAIGALVLARRPAMASRLPGAAVLGSLALAMVLAVAAPALEAVATRSPAQAATDVLSTAPIDHVPIQAKAYGTLWDRSVTARLVLHEIGEHPGDLVTGSGFGSFERVAESDDRLAPGRRMVRSNDTASLTYWDGDQKARFHSHNTLYEMTLSSGLAAAVAWLAFVWLMARDVGHDRLVAGVTLLAALVVGASLWFLVNATAPLIALAIAAVCAGECAAAPVRTPRPAVAAALTLACSGLTLATAAAAAFAGAAVSGERLERAFVPVFALPGTGPICQGYEALTLPNRQVNRELYKILVRRIAEAKEQAPLELAMRKGNLSNFSCMMRKAAEGGDTLSLLASLKARADLSDMLGATSPIPGSIMGPDYARWQADLDLLLGKAPLRTDLVMPYVQWLQARGRKDDVRETVSHFLPAVAEGDPVRPWLMAQRDQASDDPAGYRVHIGTAFSEGIANIVAVPVTQAKAILKAER